MAETTYYLVELSTRCTDKFVESLGLTGLSKSQVREMQHLDAYSSSSGPTAPTGTARSSA